MQELISREEMEGHFSLTLLDQLDKEQIPSNNRQCPVLVADSGDLLVHRYHFCNLNTL